MASLYDALGRGDEALLLSTLHPSFRARFADGMPAGAGVAVGPSEAKEHWWQIGAMYRVRPEVDEYLPCADGRVVAVGTYRGTRRSDGQPVEARFCHLWRFQDGQLAELEQITDTARW